MIVFLMLGSFLGGEDRNTKTGLPRPVFAFIF
jgi:hypothetical protein